MQFGLVFEWKFCSCKSSGICINKSKAKTIDPCLHKVWTGVNLLRSSVSSCQMSSALKVHIETTTERLIYKPHKRSRRGPTTYSLLKDSMHTQSNVIWQNRSTEPLISLQILQPNHPHHSNPKPSPFISTYATTGYNTLVHCITCMINKNIGKGVQGEWSPAALVHHSQGIYDPLTANHCQVITAH